MTNNFRQSLASILLVFALAFSFAAGLGISHSTHAQEASPSPTPATQAVNKIELHQALLDLTNTWTVMCVAAHPDDEDGTTLTVLRRKNGVHTVSLFSTYGEGGQNAVGPELYEELGVIRAQETMKAAGIQGSEPYFLGLKDFGFSKSADEAFKFWGHDEALRRMVLKIRELRPDVIITHHDTTSGHGHHQATGRLIIEAFDAAADPKRFPEQLNQVEPWQAQRLFVRIFGGAIAPKPDGQGEPEKIVTIDPNELDPVRGTSFAEQALAALQQHATQGPWPKTMADLLRARRIEGGKLPPIRYRLIREAAGVPTLPVNATTPLDGLEVSQAPEAFQPDALPQIDGRPLTDFVDQPDRVFAALVDWRASRHLADSPAKDTNRSRLFELRSNHALAIASGVALTLNSRADVLVPGIDTTFSINLSNAGLRSIHVDDLRLDSWGQIVRPNTAEDLLPDTETVVMVDRTTPKDARLTVPKEVHLYDGLFLGQRTEAVATLEINGAQFAVSSGLALDVVPAVELKKITPSPCVRTEETLGRCTLLNVSLANHVAAPFRGTVEITVSDSPRRHTRSVRHQLVLGPNETRNDTLSFHDARPDREILRELRQSGSIAISIEALDSTKLVTRRTVPVIYSAARVVPNLHVGYVSSFDETLKNSLAALGVDAKELTVADIQEGELSTYQTIIIDNRGYEAHPELIAANSRLLDFVNAGGTLLVFYHKSNEWNPDPNRHRPQLAPYPIVLGDERVTDETAPVRFLMPRHPLLNVPNRIRQADFANWIQERGLYYPKEWDAHYVPLFSTNDPGEAPLKGGLLVARYGKGNYIYTSMVWYRELRAGVPGAYRMFANMISYGHK
jgi:LmbE family N-acetylglucosaminyl deacetylase